MKLPGAPNLSYGLALALSLFALPAASQGPAPAPNKSEAAQAEVRFDRLVGRWVRPDGGYVIAINSDPHAAIFNVSDLCIVDDIIGFIDAFEVFEKED